MDCLDYKPCLLAGFSFCLKFYEHKVYHFVFYLHNPFKTIILFMALQIGDIAPEFTLYNSDKNKVNLSDYAGTKNVLLLFFPVAFTGVCTKELCSVRDGINRYNNENSEVLGISVDSVYTLKKYKEEQSFNFTLLSDFNKVVSNGYQSIYETFSNMGMLGVSKRSAFIIDKSGIIQYVEVLENPEAMPDFVAIDRKMEQLA